MNGEENYVFKGRRAELSIQVFMDSKVKVKSRVVTKRLTLKTYE
jgi:hypothetical protein